MLCSNDKQTEERLIKPLSMLTPAEYDALMIERSFDNQIKRVQQQHGIKITGVSFDKDGELRIEWEEA